MQRRRTDLVAAGLTVLRAFFTAGCPNNVSPPGNFNDWSRLVRGSLLWLGQPDPWLSTVGVRQDSPEIENNIAALHAWYEVFGSAKKTTKEVVEATIDRTQPAMGSFGKLVNPELRDALQVVCSDKPNSQDLGNWLRSIKGRPIGDYQAVQAGKLDGNVRWRVMKNGEPISEAGGRKSIIDAMFR